MSETAEQEVRAAWEPVEAFHNACGGFTIQSNAYDDAELEVIMETEDEAWQAALAFTRQRQQEIAEIDSEIKLMNLFNGDLSWAAWQEEIERILARLTSQRDELKKGMK